jgi:Mrp family chromosome partitioning ATPase
MINTLLGLAGGMTLGIALVILFTALDHRIYASWELEKELGLNVLCSIPAIEKQGPLFSSLTELPLPEATSGLIQVLGKLDLIGRDMGRVMLVTSPTSGEGKTTLALQLACALSRDKRTNVLLIDAALKSGGLSSLIPHEGVEGMVDVLKNERTIAEVLRPTAIKNLAFVPTGTIGNRLELGFFKKTLHEAIAAIRPGYDVIIIDAAGLLVSPEAPLLASEADAVLMTIKAGATHKEPLRNALELLGQLGICSCDAVLNFRRFPIPPAFYRSI